MRASNISVNRMVRDFAKRSAALRRLMPPRDVAVREEAARAREMYERVATRAQKIHEHIAAQIAKNSHGRISRQCSVCEEYSHGNGNSHGIPVGGAVPAWADHWMCDDCLNRWFIAQMQTRRAIECQICGWQPDHADMMRILHAVNIPAYLRWAERMRRPVGVPHAGRCPHCGEVAEKIGGCDNMVCICGETYCYQCGASVFGHGHRCPTPIQGEFIRHIGAIVLLIAWIGMLIWGLLTGRLTISVSFAPRVVVDLQ